MKKMNWVQTPYLRNAHIGIHAKVAFDCFVDSQMFEICKSSFQGYISKNGKKTAVYDAHVISNLMRNDFDIELDGVRIQKSAHYTNEDLIGQSINSNNTHVVKLAQLYEKVLAQENFKTDFSRELNSIFDNKPFKNLTKKTEPADANFEIFKIGSVEVLFDFKYKVEKAITWEEPSHEDFVPVAVYRALAPEKVAELKSFLDKKAKEYSPLSYDVDYQWQPGFEGQTFEAKQKKGPGYR